MSSEFSLIDRIRARAASDSLSDHVVLGIGDDAAVLQPSADTQIVATADNLVQGRHFDRHATPAEIGHLALAVNLSDLAAMGATPRSSLLTLTLPEADKAWLDAFLDGYLKLSQAHQCALIGGNITRGPLNVAVTALGEVAKDAYASRSGARPGDRIVVTGTLGDAAAALKFKAPALRERLLKPTPRVSAGQRLARQAHAMIDISDGLLAELSHLLGPLGAQLLLDVLPTSAALKQCVATAENRWPLQLNGGGDYELLALLPAEAELPEQIADTALTEIGRVRASEGIQCLDAHGQAVDYAIRGWDHFRP